jgi:glutaconate CoA-transferase subunit A
VVVRAPAIDVAILHAEAAHPDGWAIAAGDRYLDVLLARAAKTVILSTERLIDDAELEARHRDVHLLASYVDAIVVAPRAALPGSCIPEYLIELPAVLAYLDLCAGADATRERMLAALCGET